MLSCRDGSTRVQRDGSLTVIKALLLIRLDHVVLNHLAHDAGKGDFSAVVLLVVLPPRVEEAGLVLEELGRHLCRGDLSARADSAARIGIHLEGATSGVVGQVELVAKARGNLDELLGRGKAKLAGDVLIKGTIRLVF